MTIQGFSYLVLLAIAWVAAWPIRNVRTRQLYFLVSSYLFYASWGLMFAAVLAASSLLNYACGAALRRSPTSGRLWAGVALNVILLALFKYLPALTPHILLTSNRGGIVAELIMPIGISFWTFEALSYLFDVYQEEQIDPSLLEFCLYMAFWPTVLAGPICRMPEMLGQFRQSEAPQWRDIAVGTRRIVIGLFMKLVLAGVLATGLQGGQGVDYGFDQLSSGWSGTDVCFLAIGFGFQLFFDFAGYCHIVIGSARLFGIRLPENFSRPYLSTSPAIFWTRWHMTLSFWIRDYVFLPLAMVRREQWWRSFSIILAMALFGLWQAATATMILCGVYHGVLLVAHRQIQRVRRSARIAIPIIADNVLSWVCTFFPISLGWVLFRAHDLRQAVVMLRAAASPDGYWRLSLRPDYYLLVFTVMAVYLLCSAIGPAIARWRRYPLFERGLLLVSPAAYAAAAILIIAWSGREAPFVYFQF